MDDATETALDEKPATDKLDVTVLEMDDAEDTIDVAADAASSGVPPAVTVEAATVAAASATSCECPSDNADDMAEAALDAATLLLVEDITEDTTEATVAA